MALKLIGAGFGRTGTMSVYTALNQLGFPCYHMVEVIMNKANKSHLGFWRRVANAPEGTQHDWDQVLSNYTAAVDNPACCVWRELLAANPDARVLLTLHPKDANAWFDSTIETIYFTENRWQFKVLEAVTPWARAFGDMSRKLIWQRFLHNAMPDRARAVQQYQRHIDDVKAAVPADRLLIFKVTDGWKPLCDFLGVPVPATPFPNVNDRKEIQKALAAITKGAYAILAIGAAIAVAIVYLLWRFLA